MSFHVIATSLPAVATPPYVKLVNSTVGLIVNTFSLTSTFEGAFASSTFTSAWLVGVLGISQLYEMNGAELL